MPRSPLAQSPGGKLKSTWESPCCLSRAAISAGDEVIGKEELYAIEARRRCRGEAVEELHLREHQAEICREFRHELLSRPASRSIQGGDLLVGEQADLRAAKYQKELGRFLQLLDGVGGSIQGGAGDHRSMVGEQDRMMLSREPPYCRGQA